MGFLLIAINYLSIRKIFGLIIDSILKQTLNQKEADVFSKKNLWITFLALAGLLKLFLILVFLHITLNVLKFPIWPFICGTFLGIGGIFFRFVFLHRSQV